MEAKAKWHKFWQRLGVGGSPEPHFAILEMRYAEPHRAYHNLMHVMDCLREFESAQNLARDPATVEMALWYHDAIYDPRAKDNEERSAELAVDVGKDIGLPDSFRETVKTLILATKKHDASNNYDAAIMIDVDLSVLGRPLLHFDEYEKQIRQEYDWVPDDAFAVGRSTILETFLARPTIYFTEFFRNKYERQARENLSRSIQKLRGPKQPGAGKNA